MRRVQEAYILKDLQKKWFFWWGLANQEKRGFLKSL
jgi:hypothetical protein